MESFPVGQRIAFDGDRGRIWAVCRACGRWNLSPVEERWESIEACERLFRDSPRYVETEHIALARRASGLDLVRVGRPGRNEFAAWRYGHTFLRRWWRERIKSLAYAGGGMFALPLVVPVAAWEELTERRTLLCLPGDDGEDVRVTRRHARKIRLVAAADGDWNLVIPGRGGRVAEVRGEDAVRVAGRLLPRVNRGGATELQVKIAVHQLEQHGTGAAYFDHAAPLVRSEPLFGNANSSVVRAPSEIRLALEMAAHEEAERKALQGELRDLEAAWREAEEIAAIADDLLVPARIRTMLGRLRRQA